MKKQVLFDAPTTAKFNPEILTQPNIPKPLHGVAPRVVLGEAWWIQERALSRNRAKGHCEACGIADYLSGRALEAHETYETNYKTGVATYLETAMLCHKCHNFIHSGRLQMIMGKEKTREEVKAILTHGFTTLKGTKFKAFHPTCELADELKVKRQGVQAAKLPTSSIPWGDWRMQVLGKTHPPLFPTYIAWATHFKVEVYQ